MTEMKKIRVTMPNGDKYDIPYDFVADVRAKYYAKKDSEEDGDDYNEVYKQEMEAANEDTYNVYDWLVNNMNWSDVAHVAKLVPRDNHFLSEKELTQGIMNGKKEIISVGDNGKEKIIDVYGDDE